MLKILKIAKVRKEDNGKFKGEEIEVFMKLGVVVIPDRSESDKLIVTNCGPLLIFRRHKSVTAASKTHYFLK